MASLRKRILPGGELRWLVDYRDGAGARRYRQFSTRREADSFLVDARSEVAAGTHTPDRASITVRLRQSSGSSAANATGWSGRPSMPTGSTSTCTSSRASAR